VEWLLWGAAVIGGCTGEPAEGGGVRVCEREEGNGIKESESMRKGMGWGSASAPAATGGY